MGLCWYEKYVTFNHNVHFSNDGKALAQHLRVVAEELNRSSDVLDGTVSDAINFFEEVNGRITAYDFA